MNAKGPQDPAGGFLKNQVDLAVYRGSEIMQSASDLFNYCELHHLKYTKSTYCKRRIFCYVEKIDRNNISFKAVPGIRRLHQVVSTKSNNSSQYVVLYAINWNRWVVHDLSRSCLGRIY